MADGSEEPMLAIVRAIRGDVADPKAELGDLTTRTTSIELQMGQMRADEQTHHAGIMARSDRTETRLDWVERRLGLAEA